MSRFGGYTLILIGLITCIFGILGALLGLPLIFLGAMVVVKRSLDL